MSNPRSSTINVGGWKDVSVGNLGFRPRISFKVFSSKAANVFEFFEVEKYLMSGHSSSTVNKEPSYLLTLFGQGEPF